MRTNIFKNKIYYFILSGFLFLLVNENALAISKCTNEPTRLEWSSVSASNYEGGLVSGSLLCSFGVSLGGHQDMIPTAGCTVYYRAGNGAGWSPYSYSSLVVDSTRVWNGSACVQPTGALTFPSGSSCSIETGQSSCTVPVSWSTSNPIGTSAITSNTTDDGLPDPGTIVYSTNSGGPSPVVVSWLPTASRDLYFYNSGILMDTETITTTGCQDGAWDTVSGTCRNPRVDTASIVGQYYPPGRLSLTCIDSNAYSIDITTGGVPVSLVPITPYSGEVIIDDILNSNDYAVKCHYGSVSHSRPLTYDATPPPAEVSINVSPKTISKDEKVIVSWDTKYPTDTCTLTAKVVCANNACSAAQLVSSSTLNALLLSASTDANDPATSRLIIDAITKVAPGHKDIDDPLVTDDYKALGKKTIQVTHTTDITYDCGGGLKETKRIQVTRSEEQ